MLLAKHNAILADLIKQSWSVQPNFLPPEPIAELRHTATLYHEQGLFKAAKIGAGGATLNSAIRNDKTLWIQPENSKIEQYFCLEMDALRQHLNQALFLGLFEYEAHFARYDVGSFYKKHLDQFQGQVSRKVSTVVYLNDNWQTADGGELLLYNQQDQKLTQISPLGGTLVCFLSDQIPHEVKPAHKERWSIAGWFRTR